MSEKKQAFVRAVKLVTACVAVYLFNYLFRNVLSVATPLMLQTGRYTKEGIALLSSTYMVVYAIGQLVNGTLGDYIKPRLMVSCGTLLAGIGLVLFPLVDSQALQTVCFCLLGFGLSMLRGPLVKTVSENTAPTYARFCCMLFSVTSFAGPMLASLAAMVFGWDGAFTFSGILSLATAAGVYLLFGHYEKTGDIVPIESKGEKKKADLFVLFRTENFFIYFLLAMAVEAMISSVGFWIPTYLTEHLGYSVEAAGGLYSMMSLLKSLGAFLCLGIVVLFHDDCMKMMGVMFAAATLLYCAMAFVRGATALVVLMTAARVVSGFGTSAMWTIYIPSLAKTGKVSGANGLLDFSGYIGASAANMVLSALIDSLGWDKMPLSFGAITFIAAVLCLIGVILSNKRRKVEC